MKNAQDEGFQLVVFQDRTELKDYFSGKINQSNQIDETVRPSTLVKRSHLSSKGGAKVVQAQAQQSVLKRRDAKAEEKALQKMKLFEHLLANERKLASRSTAVQS